MGASGSLGVLLDHVQDKIVLVDEQGDITYANDAVEYTFGYDTDAIVGRNAFEYVHPEDVDQVKATFERTIAGEEFTANTATYRFRASDGSWIWLESRMSNLTDEELSGYVVSSRDISDRVAAERERDETADRLAGLTAVAGDALWMFNADWSELLFVNPAYEEIYGKPAAELRADPAAFKETIHPDDLPRVEEAMACLSDGTPVDMEYRVNPEADYGVWVWVQAEPIVRDGEVVRITGFSRDITDRHRRKRQLYVMDKLLRHNLRNDLTTILGQAELIEESVPSTSEQVAVIRRTGEALLETAEKQREVIDMLTKDATVERVDVSEVVAESVAAVRERFPDATIAVEAPPSAPACGMAQLRLAVVELVENAVSHSEADRPTVRVTVDTDADHVTVVVADEALPMPANERQVLTGNHEMTDLYHSTGLGLWLVYWVVELLDGTIEVTETASGNEIRARLPASDQCQ
jgi:PAS domain S-box-containing protein